jgi:hypothetical protein
VETTNYRTARLPSDIELPVYLKDEGEFGRFYKALFSRQVQKEDTRPVFLEYAWDMTWCDPCAADPLSNDELRDLGVFWLTPLTPDGPSPMAGRQSSRMPIGRGPSPTNVFMTRLHVRYDNAHFPEDLVFQETADRTNFQGRYILRHAWAGGESCAAAEAYRRTLRDRHEQEAERLASLTGWDVAGIRRKMNLGQAPGPQPESTWWERIWKK